MTGLRPRCFVRSAASVALAVISLCAASRASAGTAVVVVGPEGFSRVTAIASELRARGIDVVTEESASASASTATVRVSADGSVVVVVVRGTPDGDRRESFDAAEEDSVVARRVAETIRISEHTHVATAPAAVTAPTVPAPPPPRPTAAATAPVMRSYAWETALSDVGSLALIGTPIVSAALEGPPKGLTSYLGLIGVGGSLLAPPIVHWSHGQVGKGFASLGLRVAVPVLTAAAYGSTFALTKAARGGSCYGGGDVPEDYCELPSAVAAVTVGVAGLVSVIVLDALVLANAPVRPSTSASSSASFRRFTPSLQIGADHATLALTGTLF